MNAFPARRTYLLTLRWAAVAGSLLLSYFGDLGTVRAPFVPVFAATLTFNAALSLLSLAPSTRDSRWTVHVLLAADIGQATAGTYLAAGCYSAFFCVLILVAVESTLALRPAATVAYVATGAALHVPAAALSAPIDWPELAVPITVRKLLILAVVTALAVVVSEYVRGQERSRREAEKRSAQVGSLNELFLQLNRPGAAIGETLSTLLAGAAGLTGSKVALAAFSDAALGCWLWAGNPATGEALCERTPASSCGLPAGHAGLLTLGPAYGQPLPEALAGRGLRAVAGVPIEGHAGESIGTLLVGRDGPTLSQPEWLLLFTLAREVELLVRNAQLYATEHAQLLRFQQFELARQTFLSAAAHELRTPLTVIKTLLPAIADWDAVTPAHRDEILTIVEHNLARLEGLSSDLLESMRLETGAVSLRKRAIDLGQRVQRVVYALQPLLLTKRQHVACELPAEGAIVIADRRRVDQMLSSLLHNAHKFAPAGGCISVTVSVQGSVATVRVEDNGPGIAPEARDRVFDKFWSTPAGSAPAGLGLGLYLCRELALLHGGRLWYEDRPGGGSRFCLSLPLATGGDDGQGNQDHTRC